MPSSTQSVASSFPKLNGIAYISLRLLFQVDFYVNLACSVLKEPKMLDQELSKLNARLQMRTFLVGYKISIADLAVWTALNGIEELPCICDHSLICS